MKSTSLLRLSTPSQGLHEITDRVAACVDELRSGAGGRADEGLVTLFLRHTSASLLIQENADPSARRDLEAWLARLVPEDDPLWTHITEGPDDMPAHVRTMLTATQLSIPLMDGRLGLGTWQGIWLWEHRRAGGSRELLIHLGR
jgi:secondary thiamine-phosphate synthase enzyme